MKLLEHTDGVLVLHVNDRIDTATSREEGSPPARLDPWA
jgi:hypothetical protein